MIVRDEAATILTTLQNLISKLCIDHWIIHDTGSTDRTPEIIESFFREAGIPGRLIHRAWENFGANRQYALKDAEGLTEYVLFFDADNLVEGDFPALPGNVDSFTVNMRRGATRYPAKLIVRNDGRYRWRGVVHEGLYFNGSAERVSHLDGAYWVESRRAGARSRDGATYYKDARLLADAIKNLSVEDQDLLPRYAFYCANSWRDAEVPREAAEWYRRRIALGGWQDEVYLSWLGLGIELTKLERPAEAVSAYLAGQEVCPERAECYYKLAQLQRDRGHFHSALLFAAEGLKRPVPDAGRLFVWRDVYSFWLDFEYLHALKDLGRLSEGTSALARMRKSDAPAHLYGVLGL